jgi:hypothetical protein
MAHEHRVVGGQAVPRERLQTLLAQQRKWGG